MLKKIISAVYLVSLLLCLVGLPTSAILLTLKLCAATRLSWLSCCIPLIVVFAVFPFVIVGRAIIKNWR